MLRYTQYRHSIGLGLVQYPIEFWHLNSIGFRFSGTWTSILYTSYSFEFCRKKMDRSNSIGLLLGSMKLATVEVVTAVHRAGLAASSTSHASSHSTSLCQERSAHPPAHWASLVLKPPRLRAPAGRHWSTTWAAAVLARTATDAPQTTQQEHVGPRSRGACRFVTGCSDTEPLGLDRMGHTAATVGGSGVCVNVSLWKKLS